MSRPTWDFLLYLLGRRAARTTVTAAERALLRDLAHGQRVVVEVGVFEGATSAALAEVLAPGGRLWLVDPYVLGTRPERLLRRSFTRTIARRTVRPWSDRTTFLRQTSTAAAASGAIPDGVELVFVDADHSYAAVREDFLTWAPHLAPGGVIAFHDSRPCPARPDLVPETGPVRLAAEILRGEHGPWRLAGAADSVTAITRDP